MGKKRLRDMTWDDYGISKHRYQELKAFCLQYEEKKSKIERGVPGMNYDGMPKGSSKGDSLERQAMRNVMYQEDCKMIEQAAVAASPDIYPYIIKSVTNGLTYEFIPCGDLTIDYSVVEDYVFGLEEKYGVTVLGIGYDRYNALSSAQKWADKYDCVEVRQHSDTLHAPMKFLYEEIMGKRFRYERNDLFEINFENVRIRYDTTLRMIMDKKRSVGKIDMVAALVDAVYLLQQSSLFDNARILQGIDEFLAD